MSFTVFLAICILGCDFMLYVLFQLVYGEKHRRPPRRPPAPIQQNPTHASKEAEESNVFSFPQRPIHNRTGFF